MKQKTILKTIIILSVIGILVSLYLVKDHYSSVEKGSICDFSEVVSCSLVNSSQYSELFKVPVSVFGVIWFIILILMSWKAFSKAETAVAILGWLIIGMLFVLYLIFAEILLKAICPLCTVVHILTLIIFLLSIVLYKNLSNHEKIKGRKSLGSWIILAIILNGIVLLAFNLLSLSSQGNYDELAKCITAKGVVMYGSFKCGVCAKNRAIFGDSFKYIVEIECHPQGKNAQTDLCLKKEIQGTPTWVLQPEGIEQKRHLGFLSIEELKKFSGCV